MWFVIEFYGDSVGFVEGPFATEDKARSRANTLAEKASQIRFVIAKGIAEVVNTPKLSYTKFV